MPAAANALRWSADFPRTAPHARPNLGDLDVEKGRRWKWLFGCFFFLIVFCLWFCFLLGFFEGCSHGVLFHQFCLVFYLKSNHITAYNFYRRLIFVQEVGNKYTNCTLQTSKQPSSDPNKTNQKY